MNELNLSDAISLLQSRDDGRELLELICNLAALGPNRPMLFTDFLSPLNALLELGIRHPAVFAAISGSLLPDETEQEQASAYDDNNGAEEDVGEALFAAMSGSLLPDETEQEQASTCDDLNGEEEDVEEEDTNTEHAPGIKARRKNYQLRIMRERRARLAMALEIHQFETGRNLNGAGRRAFMIQQQKEWAAQKEKFIDFAAPWTERNSQIRTFWEIIEASLADRLDKIKSYVSLRR